VLIGSDDGMSMNHAEHKSIVWSLELHPRKGVELLIKLGVGPVSGGSWMQMHENRVESDPLLLAFAPLHRSALGVASGMVLGGLLSAATLVILISGGYPQPNLDLLAQFFWGYSVTWPGILVGFLWGFAVGFGLGWGFALVRNAVVWMWLTLIRSRAEMEHYSDFLDHL
jgi:hypothetical protein